MYTPLTITRIHDYIVVHNIGVGRILAAGDALVGVKVLRFGVLRGVMSGERVKQPSPQKILEFIRLKIVFSRAFLMYNTYNRRILSPQTDQTC